MLYFRSSFWFFLALALASGLFTNHIASAAQLTLSWTDASDNEDGFAIERRSGTSAFQRIDSVGSNVSTYTDPNLASSTTYCYRVNAFNTAGSSAYTNEICGTTLAASFTLNIAKSGSGTISSSPLGIACGSDCSEAYVGGTAVKLSAAPATGSVFGGWSGTGCSTTSADVSFTITGNMACTATFNLVTTYTLTVTRAGTGSGTVSGLTGINCASATCTTTLNSGTKVSLLANAASGSTFTGWSSNCPAGSVTMTANVTCTATFNSSGYALTTKVVNEVTSSGTSSGTIVSNPAGINCGTDCTENYTAGQAVILTPTPATNSKFQSWTGDCSGSSASSVAMNANKTCTATFSLNTVSLSVAKTGNGTVTSTPSGINCGTSCLSNFTAGATVTLNATPDAGFTFSGWTGGCSGTAACSLTLSANASVTANFVSSLSDKVGIYRPSTGEWFLDSDGNGSLDNRGTYVKPSGAGVGVPVVGDWDGSGKTRIGLFVPGTSQWFFDKNASGTWDSCNVDTCVKSFGLSTDLPIIGQWTLAPGDWIGLFRPSEKKWYLDTNRNGVLEGCRKDECPSFSIYMNGDIPVAGDWTGSGTTQLGLFRPSTGQWFLNRNANRSWNNCNKDTCISGFGGEAGDLPVIGDWDGTGTSKIGVFSPATGEWFLDFNGNGKWDEGIDLHLSYGEPGDVPVVGKW
jgi:Divergent InlB B-repeat domain